MFDQASEGIRSMGTGGMGDTATLNTGTVASQRVPASNTNSPAAAANAQAPFLANPNFNLFIDGQQVHTLVKERFEQDSPAK